MPGGLFHLLGDIVAILDSNGAVVVQYKYDAWGNPISKTGSMKDSLGTLNPFRYRGYVYDEETGLYYLRSRYYNSTLLRFSNSDILISATGELNRVNLWSYCGNNSITFVDASGTWFGIDDVFTGPIDEFIVIGGLSLLSTIGVNFAKEALESLWDAIARQKSRQEFFEYVSITKDIEAIAESFDNCECIEAANAMSKYLKKKKQNHSLVTLEFPNAYHGLVVCRDNPKEAISYTGKHVGILYKGNVYCNVYPKGLPYNDWITRFLAVDAETGEDITTPLITIKTLY